MLAESALVHQPIALIAVQTALVLHQTFVALDGRFISLTAVAAVGSQSVAGSHQYSQRVVWMGRSGVKKRINVEVGHFAFVINRC